MFKVVVQKSFLSLWQTITMKHILLQINQGYLLQNQFVFSRSTKKKTIKSFKSIAVTVDSAIQPSGASRNFSLDNSHSEQALEGENRLYDVDMSFVDAKHIIGPHSLCLTTPATNVIRASSDGHLFDVKMCDYENNDIDVNLHSIPINIDSELQILRCGYDYHRRGASAE